MPVFFAVYNLGWRIEGNGDLTIDWLSLPPAPQSILEFLSCKCKTGCARGNCSCRRHMLLCTDACGCRHVASSPCSNSPDESAGQDEEPPCVLNDSEISVDE